MELRELRDRKIEDLKKVLNEELKKLEKFANEVYKGKEKNITKGRSMRKDIARINTVINEKKFMEENLNG